MEIAVMGATGNVGSELVETLAAEGHGVRALSSAGAAPERATGEVRGYAVDLNQGTGLSAALDGAQGAFMMSGYDDAALTTAMEAAGVERVALLSSGAVPTAGPSNAVAEYHRDSEAALERSSLTATFLRPNSFMSNALKWSDAIRAGVPVTAPSRRSRSPAMTRATWPGSQRRPWSKGRAAALCE